MEMFKQSLPTQTKNEGYFKTGFSIRHLDRFSISERFKQCPIISDRTSPK